MLLWACDISCYLVMFCPHFDVHSLLLPFLLLLLVVIAIYLPTYAIISYLFDLEIHPNCLTSILVSLIGQIVTNIPQLLFHLV